MMQKRKIVLIFMLFYFFLMFYNVRATENLDVDDTYYFDEGSSNDGVAFENYDFDFQVTNLYSNANLACYDWDVSGGTDSYGGEDYCIYTSASARDACISCWDIDIPLSKMHSKSSLTNEIDDQVCSGCDWDTSDRFGDTVQSNVYYNCGQCGNSYVNSIGTFYSAVRPRQYLCENNGNDKFIVRGLYYDRYSSSLRWINYDEKYCSEIYNWYYGCAKDRDEINDNTGTTTLPNPCAIKDGPEDGNACSSSNDCISHICGGERWWFNGICNDGSDSYQIDSKFYGNSCGGRGWLDIISIEDSTCSSEMGSNNYVCDSDLIATVATSEGAVPKSSFCKLKEYSSCSADSGCWNDNGGYDCLGGSGNKICTTGANGKNCYNNDDLQCDSLRCDSTCQASLSNGQGCDENSDCINGQCGGGICGGTGVIVDLAIVKIEPVQVIKDVDLVKGKFGIVRVIVTNYGSNQSEGLVNVTFDGTQLNIASGDTPTKAIPPNRNVTFDFEFTPTSSGTKEIVANITVI